MEQIKKKVLSKPKPLRRVGTRNGKTVFIRRPDLSDWYVEAKAENTRQNKWFNLWKHIFRVRAVNDLTIGELFGIRPKNRGSHRR